MTAALPLATAPPRHVGLLFGDPSPEHEVSCSSALAVLRALPADHFQAVVIGVTRNGGFVLVDEQEAARLKLWAAAGIAYPDLLVRLIDLAFTRHAPNSAPEPERSSLYDPADDR